MVDEIRRVVARFAKERVASGRSTVVALLDEAISLGFAGGDYGAWGRSSFDESALCSVVILEELAIESAGFALCLHVKGLVNLVGDSFDDVAPAFEGVVLFPNRPCLVLVVGDELSLCEDFELEELTPRTGLEEVFIGRVLCGNGDALRGPVDVVKVAYFLGLVAVLLGNAKGALDLALKYASERYQGGALIKEHGAVKRLVGSSASRIACIEAALYGLALRFPHCGYKEVLGVWNQARGLLSDAVSDCLQVFGGYGYMEDYGIEKKLRDAMTLRCFPPSPHRVDSLLAEELF